MKVHTVQKWQPGECSEDPWVPLGDPVKVETTDSYLAACKAGYLGPMRGIERPVGANGMFFLDGSVAYQVCVPVETKKKKEEE